MKAHRDLPFRQDNQHDMDEYYHLIYDTVYELNPEIAVELGVRSGNSTRCIAAALLDTITLDDQLEGTEPRMFAYDPDLKHWKDWPDEFCLAKKLCWVQEKTGEEGFEDLKHLPHIDFIFIDTDPHSYPQTLNWLNTWVKELLAPAGIAMFHDTNWAKGVMQALTEFLLENWEDFYLELVGGKFGMGILRRKKNENV